MNSCSSKLNSALSWLHWSLASFQVSPRSFCQIKIDVVSEPFWASLSNWTGDEDFLPPKSFFSWDRHQRAFQGGQEVGSLSPQQISDNTTQEEPVLRCRFVLSGDCRSKGVAQPPHTAALVTLADQAHLLPSSAPSNLRNCRIPLNWGFSN